METAMTNHYRQLKLGNYPGDRATRALIASGVWLRVGFIGASALVGALVALIGGEARALPALAFMIAGAAVTVIGWRRARALLDRDVATSSASAPVAKAAAQDLEIRALRPSTSR